MKTILPLSVVAAIALIGPALIDPAQGIHARKDVAFAGGRVSAVAEHIAPSEARETIDGAGQLLTPGWIDLHVHVFEGVSHLGIPADPNCIAKGVTTAVDAGSAGADTFPGFRKFIIEASATRLYAQLNISSQGMLSTTMGEFEDLRWADVGKALKTIDANRDVILGVKVRLTRGNRTELMTHIRAQEGNPAVIGGPRHGDGVLIIIVWPNPNP